MKPLAVIEPDRSLRGDLLSAVEAAGFRAECFDRGADAIRSLRRRSFSLAILGLDLSDTDPFAVCREASTLVPILTIASEGDPDSCVRALESGADDCVCRPVPGRELVARVRNILQRTGDETTGLDSLEVSLTEMRVRRGDAVYDLTRGETELLELLLRHAPTPLGTVEIARLLDARRATVESRIKSLRRKVGAAHLVNREGFGYSIVAD